MIKSIAGNNETYLFASYLFREMQESTVYFGASDKRDLYEKIKERSSENNRIPVCAMIFDKQGNVEHLEGPVRLQEGQWKLLSKTEELGDCEMPDVKTELHQSFVECVFAADKKRIENQEEGNTLKHVSFEIYVCPMLSFKVFFQRA